MVVGEDLQVGDGYTLTEEKRQPRKRLHLAEGMADVETLYGEEFNMSGKMEDGLKGQTL